MAGVQSYKNEKMKLKNKTKTRLVVKVIDVSDKM